MKKLLWWLIAGMKGGLNRAKIIKMLNERPYNAHQLSDELNLDYKTIRHHIKVLEENNIVKSGDEKYGKMYFLSPAIEENYDIFTEIWEQIGKK
ncbi:MAG: winged helix-turn-helix transcriptional regulator [Methanobacterium sp.]|uniref:ArsR/SmtB family transcription factor n=1 Tax=Methanobacterium sp. TaxID=2164 RepID=UPI003D653D2F|nr:winged helix-turn-helix transcriptional regulator [Methanobacterium sp.]